MIRFGPSGIPLSCKGRTLKDGIEDIHTLGLNAMEVQFVRVNLFERYANEEEEGILPKDIEGELVVDVLRKDNKKKPATLGLNQKIRSGDVLKVLVSGIAGDAHELSEIGDLASDLDIRLSIHTPYYMDIINPGTQSEKSMENLRLSGILASGLGADVVVTHIGLYNNLNAEEATNAVIEKLKIAKREYQRLKIDALIGLEFSGKQLIFGDLEEILAICKRIKGIIPVINFAHLHARSGGVLKRREDFQEVFDSISDVTGSDSFYAHFSGVEHEGGNEKRYTPIKKGDLKFEPLAECVLNNDFEVTVISGSPLLEHDAMYMKVILERVQLKKELKRIKTEKMEKERVAKEREREKEKVRKEKERRAKEKKAKELARKREAERKKAAKAKAKKKLPKKKERVRPKKGAVPKKKVKLKPKKGAVPKKKVKLKPKKKAVPGKKGRR